MKYPTLAVAAAFAVVCLSLTTCFAQERNPAVSPAAGLNQPRIGNDGAVILRPRDWNPTATLALGPRETALPAAVSRPQGLWAGNPNKFFEGAFVGLLGHEGGHLIANYAVGSDPYLKSVHYGPIPFFTIEPGYHLTPRDHYITASAGFNAQNLYDEWILTKHPNLMKEDKPYLKGMATFSFWLTVGYAATAFAGTGPNERDTKGMADSLGWNERWVGAMILVPTALDTYRYKHPGSKWATIASRVSKLAIIGLAATVHD